jgi:hypothetical protein
MDNSIIIRIVAFTVIIPIIAYLKKDSLQKKKDKKISKLKEDNFKSELKENEISTLHNNIISEVDIQFKKEESSEFIDTYNHPDYYTTSGGFFSIFLLWGLVGIIVPIALYFIFNLSTTTIVIIAILILCASVYLLFYSIKMNKDCVLINLYSDKIIYSRKLGKFLFEIPKNKIKKLDIIVEPSSSPLWPNELIYIVIDNEYYESNIASNLKQDTDLNYIKLVNIKSIKDGIYKLKGTKNTIFNDEIFKMKYGKTLEN